MNTSDAPQIVVDAAIPGAEAAFSRFGSVRSLPAASICAETVRDADALVVRSVTRLDAELLAGSRISFAGSATSGTDHVDVPWLRKHRIRFAHARGANAESVGDYVIAALLTLAAEQERPLETMTAGVVGCGQVGGRLVRRLTALGMSVLTNDPPRERRAVSRGRKHSFVDLPEILGSANVVTLHVPLTESGMDRTHMLFGDSALAGMRPDAWLVNTSRGGVVDGTALAGRLGSGRAQAVLDVWAGEPDPDPLLVRAAYLATAHIAGYAHDSKTEATRRMADALASHLGAGSAGDPRETESPIPVDPPSEGLGRDAWLAALVTQIYDIRSDDLALRAVMKGPPGDRGAGFEQLRREYAVRRLFSRHAIHPAGVPPALRAAVFRGLRLGRLTER